MTRKNIIGAIIALLFPLLLVSELAKGLSLETGMSSYSLISLWLACAYWRYGEGIDDSYKRECAEQAAFMFGLFGFTFLRPILDKLLDSQDSLVLLAYQFALLALLLRVAPRTLGALSFPWSWRFFLFQTPAQMAKHTGS